MRLNSVAKSTPAPEQTLGQLLIFRRWITPQRNQLSPEINMSKMPRAEFKPYVSPRPICTLMLSLDKHDPQIASKEYPWADRFVMGLPLAPWQRDFKWDQQQCERFCESIWSGVHLGTYLITDMKLRSMSPDMDVVEHLPLSNIVIDGQQRLKALELYLTDKIATPDCDGKLLLWSQVDPVERRRFGNIVFSCGEIREPDELKLRMYYDTLNFGGVNHEEHECALNAEERPPKAIRP
jgi:hypothetical protein